MQGTAPVSFGPDHSKTEVEMADIAVKNFDSPDEVRPFEGKGELRVVNVGDESVGRATFEPGWRWSENVKPIAGTDSCQTYHLGYVLSGRMRISMTDGNEQEVGPGDVIVVPPGHDAHVIGDEPCQTLEFGQASQYAKRS
jgi:quercetin dioxygenase-like cupin family protein